VALPANAAPAYRRTPSIPLLLYTINCLAIALRRCHYASMELTYIGLYLPITYLIGLRARYICYIPGLIYCLLTLNPLLRLDDIYDVCEYCIAVNSDFLTPFS
jgi:hypothetical protein